MVAEQDRSGAELREELHFSPQARSILNEAARDSRTFEGMLSPVHLLHAFSTLIDGVDAMQHYGIPVPLVKRSVERVIIATEAVGNFSGPGISPQIVNILKTAERLRSKDQEEATKISPVHLLGGLIRDGGKEPIQILSGIGINFSQLEERVNRKLLISDK